MSEACEGKNLVLGPVEDDNHKGIGASAMGFGHTVIASSPIDVNLAKQVNILLENLGVPTDRILIDPTTGGLGYGLEYSYSVMERIKMAALLQGDDKLQYPIINNLGNEIWRCKEANQSAEEAPELGDPERRGILMEAVGAVSYLMSGSDILIMRHPESIRMVKSFIDLIMEGGSAQDIAPISKQLADVDIDYAATAPEPDLTIEEEKPKAAPKKAAPKKEEKKEAPKKAAPKKEEKKAEPAKEEKKPEPPKEEAKPAEDAAAKAKAEEEARKKAEDEAKAKAEQEAKAREEEEKKKKEEEEKKARAEEEAKKKAEEEELAKREEEERKLREKRAKEREELHKKREAAKEKTKTLTPAEEQKSHLDKIVEKLDRIHRRV